MKKILLPEELYQIILDARNESNNEYEKVLTYAFSFHIGAIQVSTGKYAAQKDHLLEFYGTDVDFSDNGPAGDEASRKQMKEKVKLLVNITHALLAPESSTVLIGAPGLRRWMDLVHDYFDQEMNRDDAKRETFDSFQESIILAINNQLGIEGAIKTELYFYIRQIISAILFNDPTTYIEDLLLEIRERERAMHKFLVAKTRYIAERIDDRDIPEGKEEVRLFAVARNESLRLEYFIKYYTALGVDRFFLIDNNSTDSTRDIALQHSNVHVFKINEGYKNHWNWVEYFLEQYGRGRWCVVVDIDELLHIPFGESLLSIGQLISYLETHGYTALRSFLLDMYSDRPIEESAYDKGANPLGFCSYFDPVFLESTYRFFDRKTRQYFIETVYFGGMRKRVFIMREDKHKDFCLSKISLFKFMDETYLTPGMHSINGAGIADIEGAVLHTKFLYDFGRRVTEESVREEHYDNASEYKIYTKRIKADPKLTLKYEKSVQFTNTEQLLLLGIMKSSRQYEAFIKAENGNETQLMK